MRVQLVVLSLIWASPLLSDAMAVRKTKEAEGPFGMNPTKNPVVDAIWGLIGKTTKDWPSMNPLAEEEGEYNRTKWGPSNVIEKNVTIDDVDYQKSEKLIYEDIAARKQSGQSSDGKCLKFMHIPKTGGTAINSIGLHKPKGQRPFHSLMELVFDGIAADEGNSKTAGQLFDESHANATAYPNYFWKHTHQYLWRPMPDKMAACTVHTPPVENATMDYFSDGCTNFCVIRDPLERFISTFKFNFDSLQRLERYEIKGRECTIETFEKFAVKYLGDIGKVQVSGAYGIPTASDCHFVPQVYMVYGAKSRARAKHQYCHRILNASRLDDDFNGLMKEFGRDERLSDASAEFHSGSTRCPFSRKDVKQATKDKLYQVYEADYAAFNFDFPA
jgi:hypothetical protein